MVNIVMLVGNLGADPEVRHTQAGKAVAELRVATSFGAGETQKTEWHRVILWEKNAENAAAYLHKGSKVFIKGRIQTRSYEKDGDTKYVTEIVAEEVKFLDSKPVEAEVAVPAPAKKTRAKTGTATPPDSDLPF